MKKENHILPTPKAFSRSGNFVRIGEICKADFTFSVDSNTIQAIRAKELIEKEFLRCAAISEFDGDYKITVSVKDKNSLSEGYEIRIDKKEALLCSEGIKGIFHAATVFSSLITVDETSVLLPILEIKDEPHFGTRGVYLESRYNYFLSLEDWKEAVDYFASMRFNTIFISVYNCWGYQYDGAKSQFLHVPFEKYPKLQHAYPVKYYSVKNDGWVIKPPRRSRMAQEDFLGEVIKYGMERGITVTVLFAPLSHNNLIPSLYPEISAKDENGTPKGIGMCTESDKTVDFILSLYDEIIDKYLEPNGIDSFFIGMDEVGFKFPDKVLDENGTPRNKLARCECKLCKDKSDFDLYTDYLIKLLKGLKRRGMKNVYVYYDVFFYTFDRLDEDLVKRFKDEGVYDILIFVWWNYGANLMFFRQKADKVNNLFRSIGMPMSGYENWKEFADNTENIAEMSAKCLELGFEGMVSYTTYDKMYDYNHLYLAEAAWNPSPHFLAHRDSFTEKYFKSNYPECPERALQVWRHAQPRFSYYDFADKEIFGGDLSQYLTSYIKMDIPYPRDHVRENVAKAFDNEPRYSKYFKDFFERVDPAIEFFSSGAVAPSKKNEYMILNLYNMRTEVDQARSIYNLVKKNKAGELSKEQLLSELERLINDCKKLILMIENVRIEALSYMHLRIVSITLEYLKELYDKAAASETIDFGPDNFVDTNTKIFKFLR